MDDMIEKFLEATSDEARLALGAICMLIGLRMIISTLFNSQKTVSGDVLSVVFGLVFAAVGGFLLLSAV